MLAYAADAPRFAERHRSPSALMLIVGVHAVALGVLMTTKMDVIRGTFTPTAITFVDPVAPPPEPVPPPPEVKQTTARPTESHIEVVPPVVPIGSIGDPIVGPTPIPEIGPIAGAGTAAIPHIPVPDIVRKAAVLATPDWALKPPYPQSKIASEEEAALRLRLTIDDRGRVVAVDPVGAADPAFLASARKHLIAKWRYRPATEDGRAVASSTVITLRFQLEA